MDHGTVHVIIITSWTTELSTLLLLPRGPRNCPCYYYYLVDHGTVHVIIITSCFQDTAASVTQQMCSMLTALLLFLVDHYTRPCTTDYTLRSPYVYIFSQPRGPRPCHNITITLWSPLTVLLLLPRGPRPCTTDYTLRSPYVYIFSQPLHKAHAQQTINWGHPMCIYSVNHYTRPCTTDYTLRSPYVYIFSQPLHKALHNRLYTEVTLCVYIQSTTTQGPAQQTIHWGHPMCIYSCQPLHKALHNRL